MTRGATLLRGASRTREPARRAALVAALFATLAAAWAYNVRETRDRTISLSTGNPARANMLVEVLSERFPGLLAETRGYTDEWRPPLETWCADATRGACLGWYSPAAPTGYVSGSTWLDENLQELGRIPFALEFPFVWMEGARKPKQPRDADGDGAWEILYLTERSGAVMRVTRFGPELLGAWCIDPQRMQRSVLRADWVRAERGTCEIDIMERPGAGPPAAAPRSVRLSWDHEHGVLAYPETSALPLYFLSLPGGAPMRDTDLIQAVFWPPPGTLDSLTGYTFPGRRADLHALWKPAPLAAGDEAERPEIGPRASVGLSP